MSNVLASMMHRMPHLPNAWGQKTPPDGVVGKVVGPEWSSEDKSPFKRVVLFIEWWTPLVHIYIVGFTVADEGKTGVLLRYTSVRTDSNWTSAVEEEAARCMVDIITSSHDDVLLALNLMGVGPTYHSLKRAAELNNAQENRIYERGHHER